MRIIKKIVFVFVICLSLVNIGLAQKGKDTTKVDTGKTSGQTTDTSKNTLQIDTTQSPINTDTQQIAIDTTQLVDSALVEPVTENKLTNFKLFLYILLSVIGLALFFYIFVIMLFKTFHKNRSTRQSSLLSWNLFFVVSIIWIFIIWGVVADFWSAAEFMVTMIFLFIVALVMLIISLKSK